jgi:nucleolar protein 56
LNYLPLFHFPCTNIYALLPFADNERIDASAKKSKKSKADVMDLDEPSNVADGEAEPGTEKKKKKKHKLLEELQKENGAAHANGEAEETPKKKKKKNREVLEEAESKSVTEGKKKRKKSKAGDDE